MDADHSPVRQPAPAPGGTIEPARRTTTAREPARTPVALAPERFELREPFAEVTYRANSLPEIVARAEQLGSHRFVAVAEDGKRTPIQKIDGHWVREGERSQLRPALPERPPERQPDPAPERGAVPEASTIASKSGAAREPAQAGSTGARSASRVAARAERAALADRLEAALHERYVIKRAPVKVGNLTVGHTEYRFRGDTSRVAFTESTFRLATDTNSPSVARSMVDVAEARNWKALRVSGNEDFKRLVWLEASTRGVKTLGYEPHPADLELLRREREVRLVNRIEPARDPARERAHEPSRQPVQQPIPQAGADTAAPPAEKASGRGGGGRKAVLAAIEAILVAKKVPEKQRVAVMAAATEQLAQRTRNGQPPKVKVYDQAAPSQRPVAVQTPELQRTRDRAALTPVR